MKSLIARIDKPGFSPSLLKLSTFLAALGASLAIIGQPDFVLDSETIGSLLAIWGIGGAAVGAKNHAERASAAKAA